MDAETHPEGNQSSVNESVARACSESSTFLGQVSERLSSAIDRYKCDADWNDELARLLTFGAVARSEQLDRIAGRALEDIAKDLHPEARVTHLHLMGIVAKNAQLQELIHAHPHSSPNTSSRAAAKAFSVIQAAPGNGGSEFSLTDSVAMWTLASMATIHEEVIPVLASAFGRQSKRTIGMMNRWPSFSARRRSEDLNQLSRGNAALREFLGRMWTVGLVYPHQMQSLMDLAGEVADPRDSCSCAVPIQFVNHLWGNPLEVRWRKAVKTNADQTFLAALVRASEPRRDVLCIDGFAIVLESPGVSDALLVLSVAEASDQRNANWHEARTAEEARKTWQMTGKVVPNWVWVDDSTKVDGSLNRRHSGEVDVAVILPGVFIDIQAKSARSTDFAQRERLPALEALKQHARLNTLGPTGVFRIRPARHPNAPDRLWSTSATVLGPAGLVHIPITVGTEDVHAWGTGASGPDSGFARVITTLDHLRLINTYVPEIYRSTYWFDRYAQEFEGIRFVSELDFLEKWSAVLHGETVTLKIAGPNKFALASDGPLERHLALSNSLSFGIRGPFEPRHHNIRVEEQYQRSAPAVVAPRFEKILRATAKDDPGGALGLIRCSVGSALSHAECAIVNLGDKRFSSSVGKWAVIHGSEDPRRFAAADADFVLYRSRRQGVLQWRVWQRAAWPSQLRDIRARFQLDQV